MIKSKLQHSAGSLERLDSSGLNSPPPRYRQQSNAHGFQGGRRDVEALN